MAKYFVFSILSLIIINGALAEWSDPIPISPGNVPDLAVDRNNGNVHILTIHNGLKYTKCDPNGNILSQEPVPGADQEQGGFNFGASVAVDTEGNPHIVYRISKQGSPEYAGYYIYKRSNGTWSTPLQLYPFTERGYNLRIAIDGFNNVHIVHSKYVGDGLGKLTYLRINNSVITITHPDFSGGYKYRTTDHVEIDVSRGGKVYIVGGCPVAGATFQCFVSHDQGQSFTILGNVHAASAQGHTGSPDVFVDATGNVHIAYGTDRDSDAGYKPSVRYSKWIANDQWINTNVTVRDELDEWGDGMNHGIGSIAASDDGKYLITVYLKTDGGQLRWRSSNDNGATWSDRAELAPAPTCGYAGRDKPKVRTFLKKFYAVYSNPNDGNVYVRIYSVPGFNPPVANAGGPYSGTEGSTLIFNASGSFDDVGISRYEWDWNNDGTYDDQTTDATIQHVFPDDYSGKVKLKVTDVTDLFSIAEATVTVSNANPAPNLGGNVSGDEGSPVNFSVTVHDPGMNDTHTFQWNFGDGQTNTQKNPSHTYLDNGPYTVTVIVTDNNGGTGQAQITANVRNVSPTAEAGGPYNGRIQQPVALSGNATEPGTSDVLSYEWDADNDGIYELSGQNVNAFFDSPGNHTVKLKVSDDDGGEGFDTAIVTIGTEGPVISTIPDQIVNEGTSFPPLSLDNYVNDLDNPDNELTWTYWGNDSLTVSLQNRIVNVSIPYDEWSGFENITFQVRDPENHTTQTTVKYQVKAVNDPPVLGPISDLFINEDDTTIMFQSNLVALVTDPDNSASDFQFEIINSTKIHSYYDSQANGLKIYGDLNWYGQITVTMKVSDGAGGTGTRDFKVIVSPQADPPLPFNLVSPLDESYTIWPSSLNYQWERTTDPDLGETVTYKWYLSKSQNFQPILEQSGTLSTNSYTFNNSKQKTPGIYFWRIEAIGSDGLKRFSSNTGHINYDAKMPVINQILPQTIDEGESFQKIHLDNYVEDEDNSDAEIIWQAYGQVELIVNIANRIATILTPRTDWFGVEDIIFEATDPIGLKDSCTVTFTVNDVNAKPILQSPGTISFIEDSNKKLTRSTLEGLVTDEDNSDQDFSFRLLNNRNIKSSIEENDDMLLYAAPDWCGEENVLLVVDDGAGASDSVDVKIKVHAVPDPPEAFDLISPTDGASFIAWFPIMQFTWSESIDPDPGQTVYYIWYLSRTNNFNEEDIIAQKTVVDETSLHYQADRKIHKGAYYWKVIATGMDGLFTESNSIHYFNLLTSVEQGPNNQIPKKLKLTQNHPNPFNAETWITYHLPKKINVTINIFNSLGRLIKTLVDEEKAAGVYQVRWDGTDDFGEQVSSGIYLCQLQSGNEVLIKKMLLIQ